MDPWTIRPATLKDAPALTRCIDAAYAVYAARILDLPDVSQGIAEDISRHLVFVAERDDQILGGVILIPKAGYALLTNIAVDPDAAGQGVGRGLLTRADEAARRLDLHEIRLSTHVDMPENVSLYQHLGWQVTERRGNKVKMRRPL